MDNEIQLASTRILRFPKLQHQECRRSLSFSISKTRNPIGVRRGSYNISRGLSTNVFKHIGCRLYRWRLEGSRILGFLCSIRVRTIRQYVPIIVSPWVNNPPCNPFNPPSFLSSSILYALCVYLVDALITVENWFINDSLHLSIKRSMAFRTSKTYLKNPSLFHLLYYYYYYLSKISMCLKFWTFKWTK